MICITLRLAESATFWIMQKIHLKFHFSQQKVSGKLVWKIRKLSTKDWMQLTLLSLCLTIIGMPYMGFWATKVRQNNSCPLKKPGFSYVFAKNSLAKRFCKPNFSAPVNYDLVNTARHKANGFNKCVSRKWASKLRNAVGNGDCRICFKNTQKFQLFLAKTDRQYLW